MEVKDVLLSRQRLESLSDMYEADRKQKNDMRQATEG